MSEPDFTLLEYGFDNFSSITRQSGFNRILYHLSCGLLHQIAKKPRSDSPGRNHIWGMLFTLPLFLESIPVQLEEPAQGRVKLLKPFLERVCGRHTL